jgi:hypothetical protein
MGVNPPHTSPVTNPPPPQNKPNNIFFPTTGLSAILKLHDKGAVVITSKRLNEILERLYSIGITKVDLVVELDGRQVIICGSIYRRTDRRANRTYYYIYPLGSDQLLLRSRYLAFRGNAERYSKTPLPVLIYSIVPKT